MSDRANSMGLDDLLELFTDNLELSDITASKILGNISAAITQKRIKYNMTQKEFSKFLGVSQGMISKWEGGDYNFSIKSLAEIAEKLDMELAVNLDSRRRDVQVTHMQDSDILYVISDRKTYIGKASDVGTCKSKIKLFEEKNECKIYSFRDRIEM